MQNNSLTTTGANGPPNLTESLRRSLADTLSLGDEVAKWEPPAALPRPEALRPAIAELERSLKPAAPEHMRWCVGKLVSLPTRNGDHIKAAVHSDNFIDACAHFPADLWSAGTLELLQGSTFRPSPAELYAAVNKRYEQRKRMLERARLMLNGPPEEAKPKELPIPDRLGRMQHTRQVYVRLNRMTDVARIDREIAKETGQTVPFVTNPEIPAPDERPPFVPGNSPTDRRCAQLAAAGYQQTTGKGATKPKDDAASDWDQHEVV